MHSPLLTPMQAPFWKPFVYGIAQKMCLATAKSLKVFFELPSNTMCVHMLTYRYTVLCGLLLSNTSLIKLVDYVSKDPPSEWTTGSDHTNGSGATPSAPVPRVEFPSQPLSERMCTKTTLLYNRDVYFYGSLRPIMENSYCWMQKCPQEDLWNTEEFSWVLFVPPTGMCSDLLWSSFRLVL